MIARAKDAAHHGKQDHQTEYEQPPINSDLTVRPNKYSGTASWEVTHAGSSGCYSKGTVLFETH